MGARSSIAASGPALAVALATALAASRARAGEPTVAERPPPPTTVTARPPARPTVEGQPPARPTLVPHPEVQGADVTAAEVRREGAPWQSVAWDDLAATPREPGRYEVRLRFAAAGTSVQVPPCAGRGDVRVDGRPATGWAGPLVVALGPPAGDASHEVVFRVDVSRYERRIACADRPRVGSAIRAAEGLGMLAFESPHAVRGGGQAVVYLPPGRDPAAPAKVLVGLHPWNGSIWTYAAYAELLREARARNVILLMPSGLGNSLYTADAEDEALRAIDALAGLVAGAAAAPDVSLWGASMGGAGATTIAFHHPDRFAAVTSFFGDSKYDLSTYVRAILPDEDAAHRVNALDVVDSARNLPVWLIHGEDDATSPIRQSELLADAMQARGFRVRFDRVPGIGHAGALVARFAARLVDDAASARSGVPARVTFRSARPEDVAAYGIHLERASPRRDAFVDVERRADGIHVLRAEGLRAVRIDPGALGTAPGERPPLRLDNPAAGVPVSWSPERP